MGVEVLRGYVLQRLAVVAKAIGSVGRDPRDGIKVCHLFLVLGVVIPHQPGLAGVRDEARLVRVGAPKHGEVYGAR